jgi:hypothetical protein
VAVDASEQQTIAALLREDTPPKDEPDYSDRLLQALLRQAALTGRYAASGVGGMGAAFANPLAYGANKGLEAVGSDYRFPEQHGALMGALTDMGVPEPQGTMEKAVGFASEIGVPDPTDSAKLVSSLSHMIDPNLAATVFHGSPHKWDYPDLSKVGTGTGGQARGYGLYFAESPGVAKSYITSGGLELNGKPFTEKTSKWDGHVEWALAKHDGDYNKARQEFNKSIPAKEPMNKIARNTLDEWESKGVTVKTGSFYEVDIPDEAIDNMLDWDKPLSEQPESVQRIFREVYDEPMTEMERIRGKDLYRDLAEEFRSQQDASSRLDELGIPGIKYFDGSSRSKGEGTRNFVVFNEKYVKPLKRDGKPIKEK